MSPPHEEVFAPVEGGLSEKVDHRKNAVRGLLTNFVGIALLYLIGYGLQIVELAFVSLGVNWLVFLAHGLPQDSETLFDITGTITYVTLIAWTCVQHNLFTAPGEKLRAYVLVGMSMVWALRLGAFLLHRICKAGKDSRFEQLRETKLRWLGIWTIQAAWCFVVISPVLVAVKYAGCSAVRYVDYGAWALWACAFLFEVVADHQKSAFRRAPQNKGRFITTGLWAYSRHPNYFGEIVMWIAICISVSASGCLQVRDFLIWFSPVTTLLLLKLISGVPLLEKQGQERWGDDEAYQYYVRNTPEIVPTCCRPPPYNPSSVDVPLA